MMRKSILVLCVALLAFTACNITTTSNNKVQQDSAASAITDTATAGMNRSAVATDSTLTDVLPSDHKVIDTSESPLPALAGETGEIKLDKIEGIPDFIEGCTDGSAASEKELDNEKYVFGSDGQHLGMLQVKGTRIYLRADMSQQKGDKEVFYTGHGYKVHITLDHQQTHEDTDSFTYDGTLEVEHAGKKIKMKIWGGGAC